MARRSGRGGGQSMVPSPNNPDGLGVGALAEGDLQHGERPVQEQMAQMARSVGGGGGQPPAPGGGGGGGGAPQGNPGAAMDLFGPTTRPNEPMTAGMPMGGGPSGMVLAEDPDEFLRALHQGYPHPDIARLIESREF